MNFFRTPAGPGANNVVIKNKTETVAEDETTTGNNDSSLNNNCAKCKSKFLVVSTTISKPDCVKCSYCPNWVCLQCILEKGSLSRPTAMALLDKPSIEFHCGLCQKPSMSDLLAIIKELKAANEELSNRLASLESSMPPSSTGFDLESLLAKVTAAATKAAVEAVTESMERKEKKLNLVAVGWPETGNNDHEVATNDKTKVHGYCEKLNIDPESVLRTFRNGSSTCWLADG